MEDFEINIRESYPKIITPNHLKDASNSKIGFEEIYPNEKEPGLSSKDERYDSLKIAVISIFKEWVSLIVSGIIIVISCVLALLIYLCSLVIPQDITVSIQPFLFPLILTIVVFIMLHDTYHKYVALEKNKEEIKKDNKNNRIKYSRERSRFNNLKKNVESLEFQNSEKLKRCLKDSKYNKKSIFKRLKILDDNTVKKGVSENFFFKYLHKHSDFDVYISIKFYPYYPDLIIVKNDLVFVIEIDEPYSFDSKEPIHYVGKAEDEVRDEFFVNSGFILLRFSEEQILNKTEQCLILINEIYSSCMNLKDFTKTKIYNELEQTPWSHQEAFDMAYNNTRVGIQSQIKKLEKRYSL